MDYDLIRLFDEAHAVCLFEYIPSAIAVLDDGTSSARLVDIEWRRSAGVTAEFGRLTLRWDLDAIRSHLPKIDRQLRSRWERTDDRATLVEEAAIVVAAAVMAHVEPTTRFTWRSDTGSAHDYYLNDADDEMIEIAGLWEGGLPGLFERKRDQSDQNAGLRKRWVSVTVMRASTRNRTEGLHP
jgi:hypothetical protein